MNAVGKVLGSFRGMPRGLRPLMPGGTYHVMNRGIRKMTIFEDDVDRQHFIQVLVEVRAEYGVSILALSLMRNHFHLVVNTPAANLDDFMEQLQGRFAQFSNKRHGHVGHLFERRYTAVVIEDDIQLLAAVTYVFLNPVVAGIVRRLEDWPWSSYAATAGLQACPAYLSIYWLDTLFPAKCVQSSQRRLRSLMKSPRPVRSYLLQCERAADEESVRQVIRSYIGGHLYEGPVPPLYKETLRPSLRELIPANSNADARDKAIYHARRKFGYSLAEIASAVGLHSNSVSRIIRNVQSR